MFETYVKSNPSKAFGGGYIDFCWFEIYVKQRKIDRKFSDLFETYVKPLSAAIPYRYARLSYLTL